MEFATELPRGYRGRPISHCGKKTRTQYREAWWEEEWRLSKYRREIIFSCGFNHKSGLDTRKKERLWKLGMTSADCQQRHRDPSLRTISKQSENKT